MSISKMFHSKIFVVLTWSIAALIVLLCVFRLGMLVGVKKADFSYRWSENYRRNFGGTPMNFGKQPKGFLPDLGDKEFMQGHGISGQIIKIDGQTLIVKGQDAIEKTILLNDQTVIRRIRDTIKVSDLKIDDEIVVIGTPNSIGQIEAKLVRLFNKDQK